MSIFCRSRTSQTELAAPSFQAQTRDEPTSRLWSSRKFRLVWFRRFVSFCPLLFWSKLSFDISLLWALARRLSCGIRPTLERREEEMHQGLKVDQGLLGFERVRGAQRQASISHHQSLYGVSITCFYSGNMERRHT